MVCKLFSIFIGILKFLEKAKYELHYFEEDLKIVCIIQK